MTYSPEVDDLHPLLKVTLPKLSILSDEFLAEVQEQTIRRYQNRAVEAAQMIEELIQLAREMRKASARGEELGLTEDELAFYDALETNDSAVQVLGDETLRTIARELARTVRGSVTIDWTVLEQAEAGVCRLGGSVKALYGFC